MDNGTGGEQNYPGVLPSTAHIKPEDAPPSADIPPLDVERVTVLLTSEIDILKARIHKLEAVTIDLLRAPYMEAYPYAIGNACHAVSHPDRYPEGRRPKFKPEGCPCGKRRGETV